jgi:hypothetical protein
MLTAFVALVSLSPLQQNPVKPSALVGKMLARYSNAPSLKGEILYVQSAAGKSLNGRTVVQYERPSKLYISQTIEPSDQPERIVSNGVKFLYSLPTNLATGNMAADPHQALVENVSQLDPRQDKVRNLTIGEIYGIGGGGLSPRPVPLDIAIGRNEDLLLFRSQIASLQDLGPDTVDGKAVRLIGGDWRAYSAAPVSGKYQIALTESGDLIRYVQRELIGDPRPGMPPIEVISTWIARFEVGGTPDPRLFDDRALAVRAAKQKP